MSNRKTVMPRTTSQHAWFWPQGIKALRGADRAFSRVAHPPTLAHLLSPRPTHLTSSFLLPSLPPTCGARGPMAAPPKVAGVGCRESVPDHFSVTVARVRTIPLVYWRPALSTGHPAPQLDMIRRSHWCALYASRPSAWTDQPTCGSIYLVKEKTHTTFSIGVRPTIHNLEYLYMCPDFYCGHILVSHLD